MSRQFLKQDRTPISDPVEIHYMQLLEEKIQSLSEDVKEVQADIKQIVTGMNRIVRLEEGREQHDVALSRMERDIRDHGTRISNLEMEQPITKMVRGWVIAGVIGIVALIGSQVLILSIMAGAH